MQFAVARVLDATSLRWCHPPNGDLRDLIVAGRLVAAGVKGGVPDVLIFGGLGQPCALELKRDRGGRVSPEQRDWIEGLAGLGWRTAVAHGTQQAFAQLEAWGVDVEGALEQVERTLGYRLEGGRMVPRSRRRA